MADSGNNTVFTAANFRSAGQIAGTARKCPPGHWAGFQLYHPMPEAELRACGMGGRGPGRSWPGSSNVPAL